MTKSNFKLNQQKYLQRIAYDGSTQANLETLKALQSAHLFQVPFENLDIHYDRRIELDTQSIYDKIVLRKRGGFCYELNGLFYELLIHLGFKAKRISARVYNGKNYGQEYDHMALLVEIDQIEYLCDVGFGAFTVAPLKMELNKIQQDATGDFLIETYEDSYFRVSKINKGKTVPEYIFQNEKRTLSEFIDMSDFHQTSPLSHFTKKKLISRPTDKGRITLTKNELKIKEENSSRNTLITDEHDFDLALLKYFNIKME